MTTPPPEWGADVRALWRLDPAVTHLNHGAYGATPGPALDEQARLREELERGPADFLTRTYPARMAALRAEVAAFLGADPEGLAFVPNATSGVATACAQLPLPPGGEVLVTDHGYPGVRVGLRRLTASRGARLVEVAAPLDARGAAGALMAALSERTAFVVVDAVTSPTGLVLPVGDVVAACRERGVPCVVDAAHAPGMLPVDLRALDPDVWTGNLHKWACAPKGSAVLVVRAQLRDTVRPLVASHWAEGSFTEAFDWSGTYDPTGPLAAPVSLRLLGELGWERVRAHNRALAEWGAAVVSAAAGTPPPAPGGGSLALADPGPLTADQAVALHDLLFREHRIEVPVTVWQDRYFLRLSAQVYNRAADYERLAAALPVVLRTVRRDVA